MKAKMKANWREDYKRKVVTFAEAASTWLWPTAAPYSILKQPPR